MTDDLLLAIRFGGWLLWLPFALSFVCVGVTRSLPRGRVLWIALVTFVIVIVLAAVLGFWRLVPVAVTAMSCWALGIGLRRLKRSWQNQLLAWLTVVSSAALLGYSLFLLAGFNWQPPLVHPDDSLSIPLFQLGDSKASLDFHVDALSLWFILLANLIAFAAALNVAGHADEGEYRSRLGRPPFFLASLNGFYFAMLLVPILNNLVGLWIGIELTTLASALVIGYRNTPAAWEAAWKYLIITSAGIVLALLATVFLAHAIPSPSDLPLDLAGVGSPDAQMNWTWLMQLARSSIWGCYSNQVDIWSCRSVIGACHIDQRFVILAFLFALVGYGTKAGLAPMHTWLPDGHGEAPPAISALLSGVLIKLALYAILRFYVITNAALGDTTLTSALLLGAGVLSLVVATPFILKRNRFKRVLAYHSVEHMGIICVGIGIGAKLALAGALLHTLNHAVTKAVMFLAYGNVYRQYEAAINNDDQENQMDEKAGSIICTMPITGLFRRLTEIVRAGAHKAKMFVISVRTMRITGLFPRLGYRVRDAFSRAWSFIMSDECEQRASEGKVKMKLADDQITGIVRTMPKTAAFLALAGLALIGIPPFSIFVSELMILWGALERFFHPDTDLAPVAGLPDWAVVVGIALFMLTTTLIFFGLVRHLSEHLLGTAPPGVTKGRVKERWLYDLGPLALLALGILPLFLFWQPLMTLLNHCVEILSLPGSGAR